MSHENHIKPHGNMANVVLVTECLLFTAAIIEYFSGTCCIEADSTVWKVQLHEVEIAFPIECSRKLPHNDGAGMHPRYDVTFELHNLVHENLNLHCEA